MRGKETSAPPLESVAKTFALLWFIILIIQHQYLLLSATAAFPQRDQLLVFTLPRHNLDNILSAVCITTHISELTSHGQMLQSDTAALIAVN